MQEGRRITGDHPMKVRSFILPNPSRPDCRVIITIKIECQNASDPTYPRVVLKPIDVEERHSRPHPAMTTAAVSVGMAERCGPYPAMTAAGAVGLRRSCNL